MSTSTATKRACDACHRRKVRCNGANPCQNCLQTSLACTFNKPPQKKGPKGSRAKVISELKKSQELTTTGSSSRDGSTPNSPLASPLFSRQADLLSVEFVDTCIVQYFDKMYTTIPILHRNWIQQRAMDMQASPESYCAVGSLCLYMIVQRGVDVPLMPGSFGPQMASPQQRVSAVGIRLFEDIKRVRTQTDHLDNSSTASVVTSFFLSAALFGLGKYNVAWYYLQEAITFAKIMRIHDEKSYTQAKPTDSMNRRLFWLLFISERAQALHKHRDISFHETIEFPKPEVDALEDLSITGLTCLYKLFRIVDSNVSEIWNNLRSQHAVQWPQNTAAWLAHIQQQLTDAVPHNLKCTEIQEADIRITQQWLRTIVWQLSTASGCLSSTNADESMTFRYPIEIARALSSVTTRISIPAMQVHGVGLIEKLFDIAYVLVDVIALFPGETSAYEVGPRDHLSHLLQLISAISNDESHFIGLLQNKVREVLPTMAASIGLDPISAPSPGVPSLQCMDSSSESVASSSYASSPAMSARLPPTSGRYPIAAHSSGSSQSPGLGGIVMPAGVSPQEDMASPMGSVSDSAGPSGGNIQGQYSMNFPPGSGYHG